jgi:glutamate/tyrosine decarboxylase-like PLP-dependent enzyme
MAGAHGVPYSTCGQISFEYEYGMQNSRGCRALKVWLALRQAGRDGYRESIRGDIRLAERLFA